MTSPVQINLFIFFSLVLVTDDALTGESNNKIKGVQYL